MNRSILALALVAFFPSAALAQGAYGPGACEAETTRVCIGTGVTASTNVAQWGGVATAQGPRTAATSISVTPDSSSTYWPMDLGRIGGVAFAQGQRAAASSISVVPDSGGTRWPTNPISGQTGIAGGAGASDALTTRVVIENTQGGYLSTLAGAVAGGHMQADVLAIPAVTQGTSPWVTAGSCTQGTSPWVTSASITSPLGASAAGASVSVVQDTTGDWTVDTELPAAAAPDDAISNPTTPGVTAFGTYWDTGASKWVRLRGTAAGGVLTQGTSTVSGTVAVSALPSLDGTDVDLELNGTAVVGNLADVAAGSINVVEAGRPNALGGCSSATVGDLGTDHVIVARAGRKLAWVQLGDDPDGQLRVSRAATTGVGCAVGAYLDAGGASTAGGYWEDSVGYSGAIAICAVAGTVSYCWEEVW